MTNASIAIYNLKKLNIIRTKTNHDFKILLEEYDELFLQVREQTNEIEHYEMQLSHMEKKCEVYKRQKNTLEETNAELKAKIRNLESKIDDTSSMTYHSEMDNIGE